MLGSVGPDLAGRTGRWVTVRSELGEGMSMKVRVALFAAAFCFAGSAFAFHCPLEMKKIDDAMAKGPKISAAQMEEVKKYRAEGETLHKAGKHQEALDTLAKAEKILGVPTN